MKGSLRILLLEDSHSDAQLIRDVLKNSDLAFNLNHVDCKKEYELALQNPWDVILCDYSLPGYDALGAFRKLVTRGLGGKIPFIVITGTLTDNTANEMLDIGIDDYLLKDRLARLPHAIHKQLQQRETDAQLDAQEKVSNMTTERYQTITDHSDDLITVVDALGTYVFVSKTSERMLGFRPDELLGRSGYELIPESDLEYVSRKHQAMLRSKETIVVGHGILRKDGSVIDVESSASPVIDKETGVLKEIIVIARDVSERNKERKRLDRIRRLFAEAQHMANFGNWNYDVSSYALYWSDSLRDICGVPRDVKADFDLFKSIIHPDDREHMLQGMEKVQNEGTDMESLFKIIRPDGTERILRSKTHAETDMDGKPSRLYGVIQDVTDVKRAQYELKRTLGELEQRVDERTASLAQKNQEITDSIRYAERLVRSVQPDERLFERHFQEHFIFNRPLNIIGGDFYWLHKSRKQIMLACADCTGHGVPGAFMSLLGSDLLNHIVVNQEWRHPSLVLELLDTELENRFKNGTELVNDGMDVAFCTIDTKENRLQFSGAMNPVVIVGKQGVRVLKGSRYSLGAYISSASKSFETHEVEFEKGDMLYLFSDGFQDQFGGPNDKRFMVKQLKELFEQIHQLPTEEQLDAVTRSFESWKGDNEQIDDVLVMGVRL
ncbi:MAG: PAS domain S-box protein [Flavobacteriales bacterium]|nr:PAS domain S-box protein [Flavobacteriales bacterium]